MLENILTVNYMCFLCVLFVFLVNYMCLNLLGCDGRVAKSGKRQYIYHGYTINHSRACTCHLLLHIDHNSNHCDNKYPNS